MRSSFFFFTQRDHDHFLLSRLYKYQILDSLVLPIPIRLTGSIPTLKSLASRKFIYLLQLVTAGMGLGPCIGNRLIPFVQHKFISYSILCLSLIIHKFSLGNLIEKTRICSVSSHLESRLSCIQTLNPKP
jgi:hypothetical protein